MDVSERIEEMLRKFVTANAFSENEENLRTAPITDRGENLLLETIKAFLILTHHPQFCLDRKFKIG